MDFDDSHEEAVYRQQVRQWLAEHAPDWALPVGRKETEAQKMTRARGWQSLKSAAGYVGITWPVEVGGVGGNPIEQVIFSQEESRYNVFVTPFQVGMGMCVPTLYTYMPAELAQRFVRPAMRGEEIWCQLFSEPAAGSDLAGVRTRAVREGEEWVVNGQKVWTSYANHSDFGLLLARTDSSVAKHKGMTMFFIDMRSPGVEVRPIRSMTGHTDFNEVFLTDVRIADTQRLGEVGAGWRVALTTLMHERLAIGKAADAPGVEQLISLAREISSDGVPLLHNASIREAISQVYVNDAGLEFLRMRAQTALSKGQEPGPEASIGKLVMARTRQQVGALGMDLLEAGGLDSENPKISAFQYYYLFAPGLRIAGGTDEILRNIIAERVLGLPPDLRVDRDVPFNEIK
jgi:alkylation response protein AidB-like acyl-CoA dehydrogenase